MRIAKTVIKNILKYFLYKRTIGISVFSNRDDIKKINFSKSQEFFFPQYFDIFGNTQECFNSYKEIIPDYYIFEINNGRCIIGREEVYTKDNRVVLEITSQKTNPMISSSFNRFRKIEIIDGVVANLSLSGLEDNYYHFLVEFSARIFMLKKLNIEPDYYIYPMKTTFQKEFLKYFDIDIKKIISIPDGTLVQAKKLIAPSLINNWEAVKFRNAIHYQKKYLPYWINNIYSDFFSPEVGNKRIYISRKLAKYRKVINEDVLIEYLRTKDFEIHYLESYTVQQQVELFKQCEVLIAPHGAGLVNMSYCAPGVKILELFSKYYHDHSFILHALFLKHKYNYLIGDTISVDSIPPQQEDIVIDNKVFAQAVELLLNK